MLEARWRQLQPRLRAPALRDSPAAWRLHVGCSHCQHTGFRGRLGIYELVSVSAAMQQRIAAGAPLAEVQALADAQGRRSLVEDGLIKVRAGLSSFDEVLRASGGMATD
jgi:general secretion pathway protein E